MDRKKRTFSLMEKYMTRLLLASTVSFLFLLIASGCGIVWLKVICAFISILIPGACFLYLYLAQEWKRRRSQWMVAASAAIVTCSIFSLILQFPSPAP